MFRRLVLLFRALIEGPKPVARYFDLRAFWTWLTFGVVLGIAAGLGAIAFQFSFDTVRSFCYECLVGIQPGHPGGEPPDLTFPLAPRFSPWWLLLLPAIGGLVAGIIVFRFAPEAKGHGTDAAIKAFHRKGGLIRGKVPLVKFFATIITMGTGGSGGREGPIAQIGAGIGSVLATRLGLGVKQRRWLLASGMGAGVAAIFRAPLAGALFAAEVLYSDPEVETEVIMPAAITSIVAYTVFAAKYGYGHMFTGTSHFGFSNPLELVPYLGLALVCAVAALVYIRVFYGTESLFDRIRLPAWLKPAIGGLGTGAFGLLLYTQVSDHRVLDVMSSGYGVLQDAIGNGPAVPVGVLLLIAGGKILTTSMTISSGGSAGVFGPSMVIGGTLGAAVGQTLNQWIPETVAHPSNYAVVGMAGFFAAAAKTPISTVVMVSEMTGNYELLVPAVWVCAIAFLFSRRWSIYRSQVPNRVSSPAHFAEFAGQIMGDVPVGELFKVDRKLVTLSPEMALSEILKATSTTRQRLFPVVDSQGRLLGGFHLPELMQALHEEPEGTCKAGDLAKTGFVTIHRADTVEVAQRCMTAKGVDELLVVSDDDPSRIEGVLTSADILLAYNRRLAQVESESPSPVDAQP